LGGTQEAKKIGKIVKTSLSSSDVIIGTSHALENITCKDYFCSTLDIIRSVSSSVNLVLRNLPSTKHLTLVTGSITVRCRSVRYYYKNYGTF